MAAVILLAGCAGMRPAIKEAPPVPTKLTILFADAARGAFEPEGCGCRLRGGLARRAQFVQDIRKTHPAVMLFDTGNLLFDTADLNAGAAARTRADYMLTALSLMGTEVMNVGPYDCAAGGDYLAAKADGLNLALVSANLTSGAGQGARFKPYIIKEFGETTIGIFGLAGSPDREDLRKLKGNIRLDDPFQKAQDTLHQLKREGCNLVILLSQLSMETNRRLAAQVPGIHFILGSSSAQRAQTPELIGGTTILAASAGGTHLGLLELDLANRADDFYNITARDALEQKAKELESRQLSAASQTEDRSLLQQQSRIREQIAALSGKNSFRYAVHGLDKAVAENPEVKLLVERYKEDVLKSRMPAYQESVAGINLADLPEERQRMAVRLMNELACRDAGTIADTAAADPFCSRLAALIADRIRTGATEGEVRYAVLYFSQQHKNFLDKGFPLH